MILRDLAALLKNISTYTSSEEALIDAPAFKVAHMPGRGSALPLRFVALDPEIASPLVVAVLSPVVTLSIDLESMKEQH